MQLRFTPTATQNIAAIARYIRKRSPSGARSVREAIEESLNALMLFPYAGRAQTTPKVRKLVTARFGYIIYYFVDEESQQIVVLSVRHPSQERDHEDA